MQPQRDRVVRAMTQDGAFRVLATVLESTVQEAVKRQNAEGKVAMQLAELLAGTVLVRETIHPARRVQVIYTDAEGNRFVADSRPDGSNRVLVNPGSKPDANPNNEAIIQVNHTLANGELHQGMVAVPKNATMSEAFMRYLLESEQIVSLIDVKAREATHEHSFLVAGFVVQLTPESEHDSLAEMTTHLEEFHGLEEGLASDSIDPSEIINAILEDREFAFLADSEQSFGCNCSRERMVIGLQSLPVTDLKEMVDEGKETECRCDACGETYSFSVDEVAALMATGSPRGGMKN